MKANRRLKPDIRIQEILNAAMELAESTALRDITRELVAEKAGCTNGLINHYFGTVEKLRDAVLQLGVKQWIPKIVAEGLIAGSPIAEKAPRKLKLEAADYVFKRG